MRSEREGKIHGGAVNRNSVSGSSLDISSDSESDDIFADKEESELQHSDDDSLGLELSSFDKRAPSGRITSSKVQSNSDDDF